MYRLGVADVVTDEIGCYERGDVGWILFLGCGTIGLFRVAVMAR